MFVLSCFPCCFAYVGPAAPFLHSILLFEDAAEKTLSSVVRMVVGIYLCPWEGKEKGVFSSLHKSPLSAHFHQEGPTFLENAAEPFHRIDPKEQRREDVIWISYSHALPYIPPHFVHNCVNNIKDQSHRKRTIYITLWRIGEEGRAVWRAHKIPRKRNLLV